MYIPSYRLTLSLAWLILSFCVGDSFRFRMSNLTIHPRQALFDRNYLRSVASNGQGTWNQIEMDDMLGECPRSSVESEDHRHR